MRMSRLDRKIGSFPDMCLFLLEMYKLSTIFDTTWEDL